MQAPRLRAGLIGTGFIGPVHAEALARLGIELTAVCGSARGVGALASRFAVKAAGGVRDLDGLIRVRDLGGTRCGATATAAMLDEYRRREAAGAVAGAGKAELGKGGY